MIIYVLYLIPWHSGQQSVPPTSLIILTTYYLIKQLHSQLKRSDLYLDTIQRLLVFVVSLSNVNIIDLDLL